MLVLSWPLSSNSRHKSKNDAEECAHLLADLFLYSYESYESEFLQNLVKYKMLVLSWPLSSNSRHKSKNDADEAVYVVSLTSIPEGYINEINSANLDLLLDQGYTKFALFDLLKSLYSDTKILSKYIPSLQRW
jgi:hypothetical protein